MKILDAMAKLLFVAGFLLVCLIGTAPDAPYHLLGLPLAAAGAVLAGVVSLREKRPATGGVLPWAVMLAVGYLGWRAWSSPVRHLAEMDGFLLAAVVIGFAMTWFSGRVRWIEPWIWLVAVLGAGMGLWHVFKDDQFTLLQPLKLGKPVEGARASGFFFNPNPYGTWSAMLLGLAAASFFVRGGRLLPRMWAGLAMLASAAGLLLSFCRASFLGAAVGFAVVMIMMILVAVSSRASWWKKLLMTLAIVAMTAGAWYAADAWLPALAEKRTNSGRVEDLGNATGRISYWRTGLSQFLDAPVVGSGSRTFSYLSFQYWDSRFQAIDKDPEFAHSEYVQVLADYGFLGLLVVLAVVMAAYGRVMRLAVTLLKREHGVDARAKLAWCLGVLGAGTAFLVDVFFSFSAHFAPMAMLCGLMLGGLAAIRRSGETTSAGLDRAAKWLVFAGTAAAACFLAWPGGSYGLASLQLSIAGARYEKNQTSAGQYLAAAESAVAMLPRYPVYYHAGSFASGVADDQPADQAVATRKKALDLLDHALVAFPQSLEARVDRAVLREKSGMRAAADDDFRIATDLGKKREFYYRAWMKWGEVRFLRAVDAWNAGDRADACHWLRESLAAYDESRKLAWITKDNLRYPHGRKQLEEMIAFFKRTGEWDGGGESENKKIGK